jgi:sugar lactone lactonase YvrE
MWKALGVWTSRTVVSRSRPRPTSRLEVEGLEDRLCPSQYLLVSDFGFNIVQRYDGGDGHYIDTFVPAGSGGAKKMEYIVSDITGQNILVDGFNTHNVLRFSLTDGSPNPADGQSGAEFVPAGSGGLVTPEGIAYAPDGNLLVANTTSADGNILKYDGTTGNFLGVFLDAGAGDDLSHANDMHIGPDGALYVTSSKGSIYNNGNLLRFDPTTGEPLPSPGHSGANFIDPLISGFPDGFTWGADGNLYVAVDVGSDIGGINRYDGVTGDPLPAPGQSGAVFVPSGSGGIHYIDAIAFGDDGNLYATDSGGAIQKYDGTTGAYLGAFVSGNGLVDAAGLFFYDQPATAGGGSGRYRDQLPVQLGSTVSATSPLASPFGGESSAAVRVTSAASSQPAMTNRVVVAETGSGTSGSLGILIRAKAGTDGLAVLSIGDPTLLDRS